MKTHIGDIQIGDRVVTAKTVCTRMANGVVLPIIPVNTYGIIVDKLPPCPLTGGGFPEFE